MIWTKQEIAHMAIDAAEKAGVPPALVCAIVEVSSQWNPSLRDWEPSRWLLGQHPLDFRGGEEEYLALGTRWGLMQLTGEQLRMYEWKGKFSAELGEPQGNLEAGCYILKKIIDSGSKNVLTHYFGLERRRMADLAVKLIPTFEAFVAARPPVSGIKLLQTLPTLQT